MIEPLERLGFHAAEIHQCAAYSDGRIVVPAVVAGEHTKLLLDTERRLDVSLDLSYARRRDLSYQRSTDWWGKARLTEFEALGTSRPHDTVVVFGAEGDTAEYSTVGWLGAEFIAQAIIGIDPFDWRVGLSVRPEVRQSFAGARHRLPLVPGVLSNLPVTTALRDDRRPEVRPIFLIDTCRTRSLLSLKYAERHWTGSALREARKVSAEDSGKVATHWRLPDDTVVELDVYVAEQCEPSYVADLGVPHVDGYLGLDFLYQWLPVLDLGGREVTLFDLRTHS